MRRQVDWKIMVSPTLGESDKPALVLHHVLGPEHRSEQHHQRRVRQHAEGTETESGRLRESSKSCVVARRLT